MTVLKAFFEMGDPGDARTKLTSKDGDRETLVVVGEGAEDLNPCAVPLPDCELTTVGVPGMGTGLEVKVLYGASW